MKITRMAYARLHMLARMPFARFSSGAPVYVFHHLPKCGGTSINEALAHWFVCVKDYRTGFSNHYKKPVNLDRLGSMHCLCGHFELDGYHLPQRYPEILLLNRYRVFSFVRHPLDVQLSLFQYEKKMGAERCSNIEEHLTLRRNYLAERFPVTMENYRNVLDQYFFIGLLERGQESLDILATMIGKPRRLLPVKNSTGKDAQSPRNELSPSVISRFEEENRLDYLIYEYCKEKYIEKLATLTDYPGAKALRSQ
jgi:hypothetical protein